MSEKFLNDLVAMIQDFTVFNDEEETLFHHLPKVTHLFSVANSSYVSIDITSFYVESEFAQSPHCA